MRPSRSRTAVANSSDSSRLSSRPRTAGREPALARSPRASRGPSSSAHAWARSAPAAARVSREASPRLRPADLHRAQQDRAPSRRAMVARAPPGHRPISGRVPGQGAPGQGAPGRVSGRPARRRPRASGGVSPGGPLGHHRSGPPRATRCAGQSMCGWMRRQRLASRRRARPRRARSRPPSALDQPQRDGGRARAGPAPGPGRRPRCRRRRRPAQRPPRPAGCAAERPPAGLRAIRSGAASGAVPAPGQPGARRLPGPACWSSPMICGGDLGQARTRLGGQRAPAGLRLCGRAAEPLDQRALGQVDDRAGRRAGAHPVQLPPLAVDDRRQARDLLRRCRHCSRTFLGQTAFCPLEPFGTACRARYRGRRGP